jgi:hypothetical protein
VASFRRRRVIVLLWVVFTLAFGVWNIVGTLATPAERYVTDDWNYRLDVQIATFLVMWVPISAVVLLAPALLIEKWIRSR